MDDKDLTVVDPPPDPAAATVSADLEVGQPQPSHTYQLRSRPHQPSDLHVVWRSEAPLVGPHAHENLPGPETSAPCRSVEPSDSSPPVDFSSSPMYEEEVEITSHWIASPVGFSSSESMPILSPASVAAELDSFGHTTIECTTEMPYIRSHIAVSTALQASSSWHRHLWQSLTRTVGPLPLPEMEDLIPPTLHLNRDNRQVVVVVSIMISIVYFQQNNINL